MSAVETIGTLVALGGPLLCLALAILLLLRMREGHLTIGGAAGRLLVVMLLCVAATAGVMVLSLPALRGDGSLAVFLVPLASVALMAPAWAVFAIGALVLRLSRRGAKLEEE